MSSSLQKIGSCLALRAISTIFPHHPKVVAVTSGNRLLFHVLAVGAFIPAPLRFGNYVRTSLRTPTLHYACICASTSAPHGISISLLTSYIPFPQSYPCHFPRISSGFLRSCSEFTPSKNILLILFWNTLFLKKNSNKSVISVLNQSIYTVNLQIQLLLLFLHHYHNKW